MYVCLCQGITDHQIREAAASGEHNFESAALELGVAQRCGCCAELARQIFDNALPATDFYNAA